MKEFIIMLSALTMMALPLSVSADKGNCRWAKDTLVSNRNNVLFLWHHADVRLDGLKVRYREVGCDDI